VQKLLLVSIIIQIAVFATQFAAMDSAYAQLNSNTPNGCPPGQVPVLKQDGTQSINPETKLPTCSPIDTFNNIFGQ
jgi:hypothetical protein